MVARDRHVGAACVLIHDGRTSRFNRYNDSLDKLSKAMAHYSDAAQTYSQASVALMHSFSEFFESQLQDCACVLCTEALATRRSALSWRGSHVGNVCVFGCVCVQIHQRKTTTRTPSTLDVRCLA